ncbi:WRKY Transcription Factor [Dionaea muscipula]
MSFLDELDQLHKPFLVCCDDHNVEEINDDTSPMDQDDQVKVKKPRLSTSLDPVDNIQIDSSTGEAAATPMAKRMSRKSKSKIKVVHQVAAIGSVPDKWNWRKYGQKPIKGSPYPSISSSVDEFFHCCCLIAELRGFAVLLFLLLFAVFSCGLWWDEGLEALFLQTHAGMGIIGSFFQLEFLVDSSSEVGSVRFVKVWQL